VALVMICAMPMARGADETTAAGTPDMTIGPLVSGTSAYVNGTFTWTDYAYDDTGANTNTTPGGDAAYPASLPEKNAADLIQLQFSRSRGQLRIRAVLQTLLDEAVPVVRVGFDVDSNGTTGEAALPGWTANEPLGLDVVTTLAAANAGENTVDGSVPLDAFGDAEQVRVVASAGVTGSDTVYDLAFLRAEDICEMPQADRAARCVHHVDNYMGQDQRQGDTLAGKAPAGGAVGTIDLTKLARRVNEVPEVNGRGFHYLLYHSPLNLGEGIRTSSGQTRAKALPHTIFAGPFQPYVVRLPRTLDGPIPTVVYLHGRSGNQLQGFVNNFKDFDPDAAIVGVLGRGYDVGYGGIDWSGFIEPEGAYGEQDVLDVLDDVIARGVTDPERVVLGGISMGGVGSFFVSEMNPDRFAGVVPIVGGNGGILPANWTSGFMAENLHNVPLRMANGLIDPLGHVGSQLTPAQQQALRNVDFRAWEAVRRHHEWQAGLIDCVWSDLLSRPRVVNPARVIYSVNPAFETVRKHDRAYWVSGLRVRPDALPRTITSAVTSHIEVASLARADRTVVATPVAEVGENFTAGRDYCGPSDLRSQDAWEMNGVALTPGTPQPTSNGATVDTVGFEAVTLDLERMSLDAAAPLTFTVLSDGATDLTLRGPFSGDDVELFVDGTSSGRVPVVDGAVTITANVGRHTYDLQA
jgi:hypothetical protein